MLLFEEGTQPAIDQEKHVPVIALNRRFSQLDDKEQPDPEIRHAFGLEEGGVGWDELLQKRRVVILAEAGSGKTTECRSRRESPLQAAATASLWLSKTWAVTVWNKP
jgi:hypothetical protein